MYRTPKVAAYCRRTTAIELRMSCLTNAVLRTQATAVCLFGLSTLLVGDRQRSMNNSSTYLHTGRQRLSQKLLKLKRW